MDGRLKVSVSLQLGISLRVDDVTDQLAQAQLEVDPRLRLRLESLKMCYSTFENQKL